MSRMITRAACVVGMLAALGACAVRPESSPRDIPIAERSIELVSDSGATVATGAERVYLLAPGEERLLRSVQRDAVSTTDLLQTLVRGPNDDELEADYSTFIPATTEVLGVTAQGEILTVDLSADLFELTGPSLTQAIAQIVYTATDLDSVEAVQIEIDGERQSVPTGDGTLTTEPLRIYDFPGAVLTAQPNYPASAVASS